MEPWIQTYTGRKFHFDCFCEDDIHILDIAHSLSMQCRFAGHTKRFYSVAEHSVRVAQILPQEYKMSGLFHDSAEAYIQDIVSPLKQNIDSDYIKRIEIKILKSIFDKYNIHPYSFESEIVKQADLSVLKLESNQVFDISPIDNWSNQLPDTRFMKITFWSPERAKNIFLKYFNFLKKE